MKPIEKISAAEVYEMARNLNEIKTTYFNYKILGFKMKKPTSTFWICFSIIIVGLVFCGTYYLVNKDNGRYQYESGLIIDKRTGIAKQITVK